VTDTPTTHHGGDPVTDTPTTHHGDDPVSDTPTTHHGDDPVSDTPMIEVASVSKWFGDVVAVSEVSFVVGPGVTALLGPNGAGKSTVLRVIAGLTPPSRGEASVLGRNPRTDVGVRGDIGLVPQQDALFDHQTALEFVTLAAVTFGLADPAGSARRALDLVALDPDDRRGCRTYSKGMRQRVKVAQALVHDPRVIILDEPLTGLDPLQRRHLISLFRRLGDEGRCVLVSSHVLEEVSRIGSRVLVMAEGRLAATGDFRDLRALMDDRPHRIRISTVQPRRLGARLLERGLAVGVRVEGDSTLTVDTTDAAAFGRAIAPLALEVEAGVTEIRPLDEDLESVFRYLVERRHRGTDS